MSFTRTVPATVPSLFHSSVPVRASVETKKTFLPTVVLPVGPASTGGPSTKCVPLMSCTWKAHQSEGPAREPSAWAREI
ncbi:hypothetical protein STIAU_6704, partial [Stigmatella aurantiaca DW4/3-1]